jgi:hypothetical protein
MAESRLKKILDNREQYDGHRTLITEAEAAEFLDKPLKYVSDMRHAGMLSYINYLSPHPNARPTIRYRLETIEKFQAKHECLAEADAAQ